MREGKEDGERIEERKDGRKERNKEENARTKVRNRERFLTFRTRIRVARLLLFIVAFYEGTRDYFPGRSSSAAPLSPAPFFSGGFSAVGRTEDTIT